MERAIWASFILQFRVRNRAGGGDDLRGGDIATENARLGATGPIDLLDTESAIAVRDDLAAPNAQLLDRSVSLFKRKRRLQPHRVGGAPTPSQPRTR